MLQRARQFQPATTDKWQIVAEDSDLRVTLDTRAGLLHLLLVHQNSPGKNERLRALPRRRQPALHQQFVEPRLHAARLARVRQNIRCAMNDDSVFIPHLRQGTVLDVSNSEEVKQIATGLFHKLMHICVENRS